MQRGHAYKYARCVTLAGARLDSSTTSRRALELPAPRRSLHPAHLDVAPPSRSASSWRRSRAPPACRSIVDAAYLSFPLTELGRWAGGGRLSRASRSSTSGGRTAGASSRAGRSWSRTSRRSTSRATSPAPWLTFGRAFKLDRATALRPCRTRGVDGDRSRRAPARYAEWRRRWRSAAVASVRRELKQFTLDERAGGRAGQCGRACGGAGALAAALAAGRPQRPRDRLDGMRSSSALRRCHPATSTRSSPRWPRCGQTERRSWR